MHQHKLSKQHTKAHKALSHKSPRSRTSHRVPARSMNTSGPQPIHKLPPQFLAAPPRRRKLQPHEINSGVVVKYPHQPLSADELCKLYPVSPRREVPAHIKVPGYVLGQPIPPQRSIELKTAEDIEAMREVCSMAAYIRRFAGNLVRPGITTDEIDQKTHDEIIRLNAYPSPLGYNNFPKSLCTSVNNVVCHGIPDGRVLQNGDIINLDVTLYYNGYHGDCSATFPVGEIDKEAQQLIDATKRAMDEAIAVCRPGQHFYAIGNQVQKVADEFKYGTVPNFCGHGIGEEFHMAPLIIHAANNVPGVMVRDMVFTVEPMLNETIYGDFIIHRDNWTAINASGARSAQFEETIAITKLGAEVLTKCSDEQYEYFKNLSSKE